MPQMSPMLWLSLSYLFMLFYFLFKTNKNIYITNKQLKEKQIFLKNKIIKW